MIENGICGWVGFGAQLEEHWEASQRQLAKVDDKSVTRHPLQPWGEVLSYGPARDRSFAQDKSVAVILKGRPRWLSEPLRRAAAELSDAAALLRAYERHGDGFLGQMHGPFSVLLVDARRPVALLAVDRMGIERLCFTHAGKTLAFGTSAEDVARRIADVPRLSPQALFDYLYCHMVPSPETVFAGVEKLLPAQCVVFDGKAIRREFYWRLHHRRADVAELRNLETRFRELLGAAVAREAERDDVGTFLSGGTDSSTVTGLLTKAQGRPVRTFSIGFSAEGYDEMAYARIAARHFGTQSHEYYVTPEDVAEALPLIARAYDEPFGNASAVPTYFCARLAREQGIGLLLAGDGGDEIFGGNARYAKQKVFERYYEVPPLLRKLLEPALLHAPGAAILPLLRKAQSYVRQARVPLPDRLETYNFLHRAPLEQIFESDFLRDIDPDHSLRLLREVFLRTDSHDAVDRMMHLDLKFTLADNDLRKVCRMCEVAGMEVGFPMLDDELVDFSGELPTALKVKGTRLRFFFKHALRDFLPVETLAKTKHGFGLPYGLWLSSNRSLAEQTDAALTRFASRGIVRADYIAELWRKHRAADASYFGVMIWVLIQMELWLEHHVD